MASKLDSLADSFQLAVAKGIKKIANGDLNSTIEKKDTVRSEIRTGSTQDMVPVRTVENGYIVTADGRIVSIVEFGGMNYDRLNSIAKQRAVDSFGALFNHGEKKWQFRIVSDPANADDLISNLYKNSYEKILRCNRDLERSKRDHSLKRPRFNDSLDAYMKYLKVQGEVGAISTRYYIIYEYEGDEKDPERVKRDMLVERNFVTQTVLATGAPLLSPSSADGVEAIDAFLVQTLYAFYNRKTMRTETVDDRIKRLSADYKKYNATAKHQKKITVSDIIAPKGMYLNNNNYIFMDGKYYGFFGFKANSFPGAVAGGWPNLLATGPDVDIDISCRKLPEQVVINSLKVYNRFTLKAAYAEQNNEKFDKAERTVQKLNNNRYILNAVSSGAQSLYDVSVIVTVRADTALALGDRIRQMRDAFKTYWHIQTDDCLDCAEEYLMMTMPFLYFTRPFGRLKHNMLTEQIKSIYPFTSYRFYTKKGFAIGTLKRNDEYQGDIVVINPYDTSRFNNANIMVVGSSGAGKTFTLQLMSTRLFFNGVNCYFIIPKKGSDYLRPVGMVDGEYIRLVPGSSDCVNIMEIRPEKQIDDSAIDDNSYVDRTSYLTKKISNITIWLGLLSGNDFPLTTKLISMIDEILVELYGQFGITSDNNSIFEGEKVGNPIKKMPIISDMYRAFSTYPELTGLCDVLKQFVDGTYSNFDGQTNVDLKNGFIVFDCDEDVIGQKNLAAILYIAFDFCYDRVKDPNSTRSMIVMDEVWKMMTDNDSAKQVQNIIKIVRGYGAGTILSTQELRDFMKDEHGYGASVLANSSMKLILQTSENDLKYISQYLKLTPLEQEDIHVFNHQGLFISDRDRIEINIKASDYEINCLKDKTRRIK